MSQGGQSISFDIHLHLLINELTGYSDPFLLILDDFHVIHSRHVLDMVAFLLEHLPPQEHLVLLSRTDPPFPLARLHTRRQLVEIRVEQLRFTRDEVAVFLNENMQLMLSAADLAAMEARLEFTV